MNEEKDPATVLAAAVDNLLAAINETPPFSWVCEFADWITDKLGAMLEQVKSKEDTMIILEPTGKHPDSVTVSAAEACERLAAAMDAMNGPTMPERVREEFRQIFTERVSRDGAAELLEWLDTTDFFTAPASTKHHMAFSGGLAMHSLNVYHRLREITAAAILGHPCGNHFALEGDLEEKVAIMALLHDLCKTDCYHKDDAKGYTFRDPLPMGHGEKSVYMITKYMKLTDAEALAIRWHMGAYDDAVRGGSKAFTAAMNATPWVWRLHQADMIATWEDERSGDNGGA